MNNQDKAEYYKLVENKIRRDKQCRTNPKMLSVNGNENIEKRIENNTTPPEELEETKTLKSTEKKSVNANVGIEKNDERKSIQPNGKAIKEIENNEKKSLQREKSDEILPEDLSNYNEILSKGVLDSLNILDKSANALNMQIYWKRKTRR